MNSMISKTTIKNSVISLSMLLLLGLSVSASANDSFKLTVLYNNVPLDERLSAYWGFSCLIRAKDKTILFDTGGNGNVLLSNMEKLGINPKQVDLIVLSHIHKDHIGGLGSVLRENSKVTIYLPQSFPQVFKDAIKKKGAKVVSVSTPMEISEGVYSCGEMGVRTKEQCLILKTTSGLVIITGCAHPGIVDMVKNAKGWLKDEIYLILGGFHLSKYSEPEVKGIIKGLREIGVKKVAPSHCVGNASTRLFKEAWGENFLAGGCGAILNLP